ncbi:hypothetical protein AMECASPLE_019542 [Ameca splendens]|uniref:Uncharacterized protein n=1 Tax=Ameca splendens TaxID=208324 RepID=A0ABV0Z2N6_9TELE
MINVNENKCTSSLHVRSRDYFTGLKTFQMFISVDMIYGTTGCFPLAQRPCSSSLSYHIEPIQSMSLPSKNVPCYNQQIFMYFTDYTRGFFTVNPINLNLCLPNKRKRKSK